MSKNLYDQVGGEWVLRGVIHDFVEAVVADGMIGFMFAKVNLARLREMEFQLAAELLGAKDIRYMGRPLDQAHQRHRIMGGQFARRTQILKDTLARHNVPEAAVQAWLAHTERLRPLITYQGDGDCQPISEPRG